ncbi:unnamed protein product [Musa acuminata var. zebrina]
MVIELHVIPCNVLIQFFRRKGRIFDAFNVLRETRKSRPNRRAYAIADDAEDGSFNVTRLRIRLVPSAIACNYGFDGLDKEGKVQASRVQVGKQGKCGIISWFYQ